MRYMIVYEDFYAFVSFSVITLIMLLFYAWAAYTQEEHESVRMFIISALFSCIPILIHAGNYVYSVRDIRIKCPDMQLTEPVLKNCTRINESGTP